VVKTSQLLTKTNMSSDKMEKILKGQLCYYLSLEDISLEAHLKDPSRGQKERVITIDDLQVIIYSNDHDPPHFHVKTKNKKLMRNLKLKIANYYMAK